MRAGMALSKKIIFVSICALALALAAALLFNAPSSQAQQKYIEGQHYQRITTPVKTHHPDKIEVTEVFWYGCPHCNQFSPQFIAWSKTLPEDVVATHSPAIWNKPMIVHAHIFYTAKAFRLLDTMHKEIFDAMHLDGKKLSNEKEIFTLFEKHGITQEQFDKTFDSFGVKSQVKQASARARSYGITGTPEVIVNGKYRISGRMVSSMGEVLKVADFLIAQERRTKGL